jgi:hypothetical protein
MELQMKIQSTVVALMMLTVFGMRPAAFLGLDVAGEIVPADESDPAGPYPDEPPKNKEPMDEMELPTCYDMCDMIKPEDFEFVLYLLDQLHCDDKPSHEGERIPAGEEDSDMPFGMGGEGDAPSFKDMAAGAFEAAGEMLGGGDHSQGGSGDSPKKRHGGAASAASFIKAKTTGASYPDISGCGEGDAACIETVISGWQETETAELESMVEAQKADVDRKANCGKCY